MGDSEILEEVDSLLGKVLPLGIVTFVMVTAAVILLAWGSWLGQFLFQIPAKDSLSIFSGPIVLLAVGLTLTGAFLNHKLTRPKASLSEANPARAASAPSTPKKFNHVLVPGGKDDEQVVNVPSQTRKIEAIPRAPPSSEIWTFKDAAKLYQSEGLTNTRSPRLEEPGSTFVPPDRLEARIDVFTFNCQECKGVVNLPWAKVKESFGGHELPIDCPNCHRQYPFDYEKAKRKTLTITFYGSASQSKTPEASQDAPQPVPVVTQRTIGSKAKGFIGSLANRRVIHPVAAPVQPGPSEELPKAPETKQPRPIIASENATPEQPSPPTATEETITEPVSVNTPLKTTTIAPNKEASETAPQWSFKDTKSRIESSNQDTKQPPDPQKENKVKAPPDQLKARIDVFSFTCQDCQGIVDLPWAKIRDSLGKDHLPIDCPNCHRQYPFDYEKAKKKILSITFYGVVDRKPPENPPEKTTSPRLEPLEAPEKAAEAITSREITPPTGLENTPEAVANPEITPPVEAIANPEIASPTSLA